MHHLALMAQQRVQDALRVAQKALGLPDRATVNLETGDIVMPELSETEKANIIENEMEAAQADMPPATPAAAAHAEAMGVDLTQVEGTGKDGTITKADVQAAASSAPEAAE